MKRKAYVTAPGSATVRREGFMRAGTGQRGIKVYNFRGNVTFVVMHFIWSLRTVEERSVCLPSPPDRAGRGPASSWRVSYSLLGNGALIRVFCHTAC